MADVREGIAAIQDAVDINVACSLGILTREQASELAEMGVHRYNHNLEAARSYFPEVVTTHTWEERWDTLQLVREHGMEVCCGGIIGMGETLEQRAELAAQLAALEPDEVPLNFLDPRPARRSRTCRFQPRGCAAHDRRVPARPSAHGAALRRRPRADARRPRRAARRDRRDQRDHRRQLPHHPGRDPQQDLDLLGELSMPIKALSETL
jgi:biotin synthase